MTKGFMLQSIPADLVYRYDLKISHVLITIKLGTIYFDKFHNCFKDESVIVTDTLLSINAVSDPKPKRIRSRLDCANVKITNSFRVSVSLKYISSPYEVRPGRHDFIEHTFEIPFSPFRIYQEFALYTSQSNKRKINHENGDTNYSLPYQSKSKAQKLELYSNAVPEVSVMEDHNSCENQQLMMDTERHIFDSKNIDHSVLNEDIIMFKYQIDNFELNTYLRRSVDCYHPHGVELLIFKPQLLL